MNRSPPPRSKDRHAGFSLVELMVVVTISLLIILALTALFTNNSVARREIENSGQQIENGRYAMELIRSDVRLAGYYSGFVPSWSGITWSLPTNPCDPTFANLGWDASASTIPVPVSGFEGHDTAIAGLSPQCISNRVPNSDVLVVRRTSTTALTPPPTATNTPYVQVSQQSAGCASTEAAYVFDIVKSPNPFTLHQKDCSATAAVRQYLVHVYYVSTCDDCTANDDIPTLKRVELSAGSMVTTSLAQGINDFRVEYGIDSGNDGFPDLYRKCGASSTYTGPCTVTDWSNVAMLKVYLLTRNNDPSPGYIDTKVYDMGLSGALPAFGAAAQTYRHHVYSAPIRLTNVSEPREIP